MKTPRRSPHWRTRMDDRETEACERIFIRVFELVHADACLARDPSQRAAAAQRAARDAVDSFRVGLRKDWSE